MCNFLSALRLGVSPSHHNKKSDEFGKLYNAVMLQQKEEDEAFLKSSLPENQVQEVNHQPCPQVVQISATQSPPSDMASQNSNHNNNSITDQIGPGWKIAFDNLDIFQRVREMSEDNQNRDHHWINHVMVL